jgi:hypothetical protein
MKTVKYSLLLLAVCAGFMACKKDEPEAPAPTPPPAATTGTLSVQFDNKVGDSILVLGNAKSYVTQNNDTFTVSKFNYYISNVRLIKSNGDVYVEPESYHLIQSDIASSLQFNISNVPLGDYSSIQFVIGVDSTRNVSGAQTGALDPLHGMFWSWSTGYIQAKLEGTSPQASGGSIVYHISGFSGSYNPLITKTLTFNGDVATVSASSTPVVHMKADIQEWFKSPAIIDISTTYFCMNVNATSFQIAKNYHDMFTVTHVSN